MNDEYFMATLQETIDEMRTIIEALAARVETLETRLTSLETPEPARMVAGEVDYQSGGDGRPLEEIF